MTTKAIVSIVTGVLQALYGIDTPSGANGTTTAADAGKVPLLDSAGMIPQSMERVSLADATLSGGSLF